jgi:hypothetical protein
LFLTNGFDGEQQTFRGIASYDYGLRAGSQGCLLKLGFRIDQNYPWLGIELL